MRKADAKDIKNEILAVATIPEAGKRHLVVQNAFANLFQKSGANLTEKINCALNVLPELVAKDGVAASLLVDRLVDVTGNYGHPSSGFFGIVKGADKKTRTVVVSQVLGFWNKYAFVVNDGAATFFTYGAFTGTQEEFKGLIKEVQQEQGKKNFGYFAGNALSILKYVSEKKPTLCEHFWAQNRAAKRVARLMPKGC